MNNLNSDYLSVFDTQPIAACIDWDPELRLLAVGTKGGALRVFGAPGVELLGQHEGGEELTVLRYSPQPHILETFGVIFEPVSYMTSSRVLFVPGQGRLVTLTSDNSLHLWQIGSI